MTIGALWVETPFFGLVLLWLGGLLPAAVITALKRQWALLGVGLLTFGIGWFVGAAALASPDSWWAQTFYGAKRMARASEPLRHPRPLHVPVAWTVAVLAAIVTVGLVAARPAPFVGLGGKALQESVGGGFLSSDLPPCTRDRDNSWHCLTYDQQFSGTVDYQVDARANGCWTAIREGAAGEGGSPKRFSGCVTIADYLLPRIG